MKSITDDRGQVGIGTLIVFIALVLVAAIAAGVLINTAGFLQTQAEETGQDSTDQVADNINVIGEVGEVTEDGDVDGLSDLDEDDAAVYETRLTVQRSPGSNDIDLAGLSIQYVGDNGFANLIHLSEQGEVDSGEDIENVYFVQEITAESDGDAVLTDDGDRYEIVIPQGLAIQVGDGTAGDLGDVDEIVATLDGGSVDIFGGEETEIYPNENTDVENNLEDFNEAEGQYQILNSDLDVLLEGDEASLEITTDAGATRNVAISVPDSLIGEEGGTVTL